MPKNFKFISNLTLGQVILTLYQLNDWIVFELVQILHSFQVVRFAVLTQSLKFVINYVSTKLLQQLNSFRTLANLQLQPLLNCEICIRNVMIVLDYW